MKLSMSEQNFALRLDSWSSASEQNKKLFVKHYPKKKRFAVMKRGKRQVVWHKSVMGEYKGGCDGVEVTYAPKKRVGLIAAYAVLLTAVFVEGIYMFLNTVTGSDAVMPVLGGMLVVGSLFAAFSLVRATPKKEDLEYLLKRTDAFLKKIGDK